MTTPSSPRTPGDPPGTTIDTTPLFAGDRPDRRHWTLAVAAGMASYLDAAILVSVGVSLVILQEEFGMSTWGVGALSSALTLAVAAGAFAGGRLADAFGRMRVFTIYILVYAGGMAVMAAAVNQQMLFAGVVVAGLAAGADLPTSVAVVSERSPARAQGRLVSTTQLMWTIGIATSQALAFAFSGLGMTGVRIIFTQLALVAVATWAVRRFSPALRSLEDDVAARRRDFDAERRSLPLTAVLRSRALLVPVVLSGLFYVFWGMVANTFGQFQTYFLITAGGASQTLATGLNSALIPLNIIASLLVVRFMDSRWRAPMFIGGALVQAGAMALAGLGDGVLAVYVVALSLFGLGSYFGGEAHYKVWTQESLPIDARASVQGFTYGVGRFVFALFALPTPYLLATNRNALLWLLVGFALVALVLGVALGRYLEARDLTAPTADAREAVWQPGG